MASGGRGQNRGARVLIRTMEVFFALRKQPVGPSVNALRDDGPRTPMSEPSSKMAAMNETEPLSEAQHEGVSANNKVTSGQSHLGGLLQMTDTSPKVPSKPGMRFPGVPYHGPPPGD